MMLRRISKLPVELCCLIFEFDGTYREIFSDDVIPPLESVTCCQDCKKPKVRRKYDVRREEIFEVMNRFNQMCDDIGITEENWKRYYRGYCVKCALINFEILLDEHYQDVQENQEYFRDYYRDELDQIKDEISIF